MRKVHVTVVALLLAVAAVLGTVAVTRTARVGATTTARNDTAYRERVRQLNAAEAKLRRALAAKPAATPRIVFHRPAPIIVTRHAAAGDDGHEREGGDD